MFCGNCYTMCAAMPLADEVGSGIAILVGGKISNRITRPKFSKVVIPFIPNEPPRWETTVKAVKNIWKCTPRTQRNTNASENGPRGSGGSDSSRRPGYHSPTILSTTTDLPIPPGGPQPSSNSRWYKGAIP